MKSRQRGAGLLVAVILIVTVAAFAVIVAASQTGGDVRGNDMHADGVQALYLAESGVARALKRFATGTACGLVLAEGITDLNQIALGATGYRIDIGAGLTTDFAGVALPATQCRIPVTGTVIASNVTRTVHAIVDRNLLGGATGGVVFNPTFNNPSAVGAPSTWTLTQPAGQPGYADDGGHEVDGASCSRSAWLRKERVNNYTVRAQGLLNVNFTVTGGSPTTVTFHYRLNQRGPNGTCAGGGGAAGSPADICAGAGGNPGTICFRTTDTGGTNSTGTFNSAHTVMQPVGCPDAGGISVFAPCQNGYQALYPTKATVNFNIGGGGTRTITAFRYMMRLQQAGAANARREMFLDHIEATNNTAIGAAHVRVWRDCSTAADPVNCV